MQNDTNLFLICYNKIRENLFFQLFVIVVIFYKFLHYEICYDLLSPLYARPDSKTDQADLFVTIQQIIENALFISWKNIIFVLIIHWKSVRKSNYIK